MMLQHILTFSSGKARCPEIRIHFPGEKTPKKNGLKIRTRRREKSRRGCRVAESKKLQGLGGEKWRIKEREKRKEPEIGYGCGYEK